MSSPSIDRRLGLTGNKAYKAPCDVATTANVTLSGEQTIDGVVTSSSRVLVWNQSNTVDNGIWDTSTGSWSRAIDCNTNQDIAKGTQVLVTGGTSYAGQIFEFTSANPIIPGTSSITIVRGISSSTLEARLASTASAADGLGMIATFVGSLTYAGGLGKFLQYTFGRTAGEIAASVTPVNYAYPPGHLYRYGTNTTPGTTDLTTALLNAVNSLHPYAVDDTTIQQGGEIFIPNDRIRMEGSTIDVPCHIHIKGTLGAYGAAENVDYGSQILRTANTPLLRLFAACTVSGIDFFADAEPIGVRTTIDVVDLDNHIYNNSFRGSNIGVRLDSQYVVGKTGTALIERNFFGYMFAGLNAAGILFDSTTAGAINPMTVRNNFFHVNTAAGYTGTIGIHTIGAGGLENVIIHENNFQGYTAANSIGINVYGKALSIRYNTLAAFTAATSIGVNIVSSANNTSIGIEDNYFYSTYKAIKARTLPKGRLGPNTYSAVTVNVDFDNTVDVEYSAAASNVAVTYSASMTFDASAGTRFLIEPNNATNFTINAPTNPIKGHVINVAIKNSTAGAIGTATWDAVFKRAAVATPGAGFTLSGQFEYDGTNWQMTAQAVNIVN